MKITVSLDITTSKAIPEEIIRAVMDNCRTMNAKDYGFSE